MSERLTDRPVIPSLDKIEAQLIADGLLFRPAEWKDGAPARSPTPLGVMLGHCPKQSPVYRKMLLGYQRQIEGRETILKDQTWHLEYRSSLYILGSW